MKFVILFVKTFGQRSGWRTVSGFQMLHVVHLTFLLLLSSCSTLTQIDAQRPRDTGSTPSYRRVGVYFPPSAFQKQLNVNVDGHSSLSKRTDASIDEALRKTIVYSLEAASADVRIYSSMIDLRTMQRHDLDAFFWPEFVTLSSSLSREGTLFPSYTAYGSASMKLMRMSGFRGTIDSITISGNGSYYAHGIGSARTSIARTGAEVALRDMATKLANALTGRVY